MDIRKGKLLYVFAFIFIFNLIMPFRLFVLAQANDRFRTFAFNNDFAESKHPRFSGGAFSVWEEAGEQLWLVYDSKLDSGNTEIFARVRHRDESLWRESIRLTNNTSLDEFPVVNLFNNKPMVIWQTNSRGNFDLIFSIFDGHSWSAPEFITNSTTNDIHPELFVLPIHSYPQPDTVLMILIWERDKQLYWSQYSHTNW